MSSIFTLYTPCPTLFLQLIATLISAGAWEDDAQDAQPIYLKLTNTIFNAVVELNLPKQHDHSVYHFQADPFLFRFAPRTLFRKDSGPTLDLSPGWDSSPQSLLYTVLSIPNLYSMRNLTRPRPLPPRPNPHPPRPRPAPMPHVRHQVRACFSLVHLVRVHLVYVYLVRIPVRARLVHAPRPPSRPSPRLPRPLPIASSAPVSSTPALASSTPTSSAHLVLALCVHQEELKSYGTDVRSGGCNYYLCTYMNTTRT
ncbi:hypothetical protein DFH09DRAFT_1324986 [Mycena vulgaris]|nr:hypothetical protein DFH09DRAFT_1324986 [Mycena vulgaris]